MRFKLNAFKFRFINKGDRKGEVLEDTAGLVVAM